MNHVHLFRICRLFRGSSSVHPIDYSRFFCVLVVGEVVVYSFHCVFAGLEVHSRYFSVNLDSVISLVFHIHFIFVSPLYPLVHTNHPYACAEPPFVAPQR